MFALIGLAVFVSVAALVVLYVSVSGGSGLSRSARVTSSAALVLRPDGELPELRPDDVLDQFVERDTDSLRAFVAALRRAKSDSRITSVVLVPGSLDSPYWAKVQELRDAVVDFRRSGKPVTAFLEFGGDREYYLATAADKIYLLPVELARSDRCRVLRDLPARRVRQGRCRARTSFTSATTRPPPISSPKSA